MLTIILCRLVSTACGHSGSRGSCAEEKGRGQKLVFGSYELYHEKVKVAHKKYHSSHFILSLYFELILKNVQSQP